MPQDWKKTAERILAAIERKYIPADILSGERYNALTQWQKFTVLSWAQQWEQDGHTPSRADYEELLTYAENESEDFITL